MYNPLLMCDFYKCVHAEQYPEDIALIASPYIPRMSRLEDTDHVTFFGCQAFCKEFLERAFQDYFFNRPEEKVMLEYNRILNATLGAGSYDSQKIRDLHRLGYLPIEVYAVPEGTRTKIGVPQSMFVNTHKDFAWVTNALETAYQSYMWHIQVSAEVGVRYRKIVDKYLYTCDDDVRAARLLGDFSMRGQHHPEAATTSSAGWLLSFLNTATIPAIIWLEDNYYTDCTLEEVGYGAVSTEHSVMCSNFAVDGDEITHIKRLLTRTYPNTSFSMVSDSYDYWHLVKDLLPQCKDEILAHNGCLSIRGDSGDPVEIIAGKKIDWLKPYDDYEKENLFEDFSFTDAWLYDYCREHSIETEEPLYFGWQGKMYKVNVYVEWTNERGAMTDEKYYFVDTYSFDWDEIQPTPELMGTVWTLWQEFGGTVNSKGYMVLNPHIKAIYGDSITPQRCEEIYHRLAAMGFAINNVSLGVGAFSFMCLETIDEDGEAEYSPYTRDTFGMAIKATYGEMQDGTPIMIYKQPTGTSWKKSPKGCCIVALDGESYTDEHSLQEFKESNENLMRLTWKNGVAYRADSLKEIRKRMYPRGF